MSAEYVQEQVSFIKGDTPVVELMEMYDALEGWLDRESQMFGVGDIAIGWNDTFVGEEFAALAMHPVEFYIWRDKVLEALESALNFNDHLFDGPRSSKSSI